MSYSERIRAVRAYSGLSQQALAPWLGLSRDLLASIETGRVPLPSYARPWLHPWVAAMAQQPADVAGLAACPEYTSLPPVLTGPAPVLARLLECEYQASRLHQRQSALWVRQQQAARHLAAGALLRAALPPPPTPTEPVEALTPALRRRWLARLLEAAADALLPEAPTGPVAGALLAARCRAYQHEATTLRAWLSRETAGQ